MVPSELMVTFSVQVSVAPLPLTVQLMGAVKDCSSEPEKVYVIVPVGMMTPLGMTPKVEVSYTDSPRVFVTDPPPESKMVVVSTGALFFVMLSGSGALAAVMLLESPL